MNLKKTMGAAAGTLLAFSAFAANYYVTPDGIPDLGCFEYFLPPGLMLLFR